MRTTLDVMTALRIALSMLGEYPPATSDPRPTCGVANPYVMQKRMVPFVKPASCVLNPGHNRSQARRQGGPLPDVAKLWLRLHLLRMSNGCMGCAVFIHGISHMAAIFHLRLPWLPASNGGLQGHISALVKTKKETEEACRGFPTLHHSAGYASPLSKHTFTPASKQRRTSRGTSAK